MTEAYPLQWPDGWPRTPAHRREDSKYRFRKTRWNSSSPFWTLAEARDALMRELDRIGAKHVVLSTNYEPRADGLPRSGQRRPDDTGVAVYFLLKGKQMVMACDRHARAEENLRSLALAIEAMRQLERHGGGVMMERAFSGFEALPPPDVDRHWWEVLSVPERADLEQIHTAYRKKAKEAHPDSPTGSTEAFQALQNAYSRAQQVRKR